MINIPIKPECSEMDNFYIKKMGCERPPRRYLYSKYDICMYTIFLRQS